jgi:methylphosphotriester-DNA--protein-cysteine methyltransferase
LVRLAHAVDRVRHEKVDVVARDVGFRSKKSFYRAFTQLTGMLPAEFRRLPPESARRIVHMIHQKF